MAVSLSVSVPGSCSTDGPCFYQVSANGTSQVVVTQVNVTFRNLQTGASLSVSQQFQGGQNIAPGAGGSAVSFNVNLALQASNLGVANLLPSVCGDGVGLQVQAYAYNASGLVGQSPPGTTTFVLTSGGGCKCATIGNVITNVDALNGCVGVDAQIGLDGKLYENGGTCGGILSPFVNQGPVVSVGLLDPATGKYYEYARASTDNTASFSIGFGVKDRTDLLALVPAAGSKAFSLVAMYVGSADHLRSAPYSRSVTVSGNQAPPCPLGTLILDQSFETVPPTETSVHHITGSFGGKLLALSDQDRAIDVMNKVKDAIIGGGAHPVRIQVYRGPNMQVPIFYGFGSVTTPGFNVVAIAWGSPITVVALAAILLAIIIILAIFVIALWFIDDIVKAGGGPALTAGAIAVTVIAGGVAAAYIYSKYKGAKK